MHPGRCTHSSNFDQSVTRHGIKSRDVIGEKFNLGSRGFIEGANTVPESSSPAFSTIMAVRYRPMANLHEISAFRIGKSQRSFVILTSLLRYKNKSLEFRE